MISPEVMQELLAVHQVLHYLPESQCTEKGWTPHEQQLFWVALTTFPQGPWTAIAEYIGTKTTRQAMTHAQKLRQKLKRWNNRLRSNPAVSSLMDAVIVTSDGSVTVSASADPSTYVSMPPNTMRLDGRIGSGEHAGAGTVGCAFHADCGALSSSHYQVPFVLGLHQHTHTAGLGHTETAVHDEVHPAIPHDFLDELVKALSSEDADDEEVTDEELKELDDGEVAR